jgi:hypothetical protein
LKTIKHAFPARNSALFIFFKRFESLFYSASAGVRCSYWFADRFFVKGFLETRKAGYLDLSIGGGVALGWNIPNQAIS